MKIIDNVFILGAGFSQAAGIPLMSGFVQKIRDIYNEDLRSSDKRRSARSEKFKVVLDFLGSYQEALGRISVRRDNIEELYSLLDAKRILSGGSYEEVRGNFIYAIAETITEHTKTRCSARNDTLMQYVRKRENIPHELRNDLNIYELFVNAMIGNSIGTESTNNYVVTFNYDEILEQAATNCHINIDFGHDKLNETRTQTWTTQAPMRFLKLHGSLGWMRHCKCDNPISLVNSKGSSYAERFLCARCQSHGEPFIVPPTWNKAAEATDLTVVQIWKLAYDALKMARRIFIIGYSLPDSDLYFRHLLMSAIQENKNHLDAIVICDTNAKSIKSKSNSFLSKDPHFDYRVYGGRAAEFIPEMIRAKFNTVGWNSTYWVD